MESQDFKATKAKGSNAEKIKYVAQRIDELNLSDLSDSGDELTGIMCKICHTSFSGQRAYDQHLDGKKHNQAVLKAKIREKLRKSGDLPNDPKDVVENDTIEWRIPSQSVSADMYCEVCDKKVSGFKNFQAHLNGSIHFKNLKQQKEKQRIIGMKEFLPDDAFDVQDPENEFLSKPFAQCKPCQKTFYSPASYSQHLEGVNHKKKMLNLNLIDDMKNDAEFENIMKNGAVKRKCDVCNKSFSGERNFQEHLQSSVHYKEVRRLELEEELSELFSKNPTEDNFLCNECKIVFPDIFSCESHMANNSHGKRKVKDELFTFVADNPEIVAVKSVQNVSSDEDGEKEENFQNGHYFLVCKLCHTSFSGQQSAKDHLKGKNHLKVKREKAERKLYRKMTEKQNGNPPTSQKDANGSENERKAPSSNGSENGSASIPDDFEILQMD